jgi:hypothetical protein
VRRRVIVSDDALPRVRAALRAGLKALRSFPE